MNYLIIDTATKNLYIALVKDKEVVEELLLEGKNMHSKNALYYIDQLTKKHAFDVEAVVCGKGPGSYTGVRIAVTIAKMFAVFKNIPLYSTSTLYLMSSGYDGKKLAYIDARRGNSFLAVYEDDINILEEGLYNTTEKISLYQNYLIIDEDNMKINPLKVICNALLEHEPHAFTPNYLRDTEAERNLR